METESLDLQAHTLPDLSIITTRERAHRVQSPPVPVSAINTMPEAAESAWLSLLAAARDERLGRLLYCFVFKRWLDLLITSVAVVILAPVFLLVAALVWLDMRGPVIYRQRRIGRYGESFTVYKFRTMIADRRRASQTYAGPERRKAHKTATDPRVTRIGKFMRRTSLDELPQLFNVLRGEMSLIGPRPELPEIVSRYEPWQHRRHLVLPGLTGWWQTHGRSGQMMHEHTDMDIYYVQHLSFAMDLRILIGTARALASRDGAF
jgi:lipopolysaccharide/colanic/teichoic acid biosynthesis glycosyltransferase